MDMMKIRIQDGGVPGNGTISSDSNPIGTVHDGRSRNIGIVPDGQHRTRACYNPHARPKLHPAHHMKNRVPVHPDRGFGMHHIPNIFAAQVQPSVNDQPGTGAPGNGTPKIRKNPEPVKTPYGVKQVQEKTIYHI